VADLNKELKKRLNIPDTPMFGVGMAAMSAAKERNLILPRG
jgi:hypothetical protein